MDPKGERGSALEPARAEHEAAADDEMTTLVECPMCGRTTFEDLWAEGLCTFCFAASMP
jgi:hypothetical protein